MLPSTARTAFSHAVSQTQFFTQKGCTPHVYYKQFKESDQEDIRLGIVTDRIDEFGYPAEFLWKSNREIRPIKPITLFDCGGSVLLKLHGYGTRRQQATCEQCQH